MTRKKKSAPAIPIPAAVYTEEYRGVTLSFTQDAIDKTKSIDLDIVAEAKASVDNALDNLETPPVIDSRPTVINLFRMLGVTIEAWCDERFADKIANKMKKQGATDEEVSAAVWAAIEARHSQKKY